MVEEADSMIEEQIRLAESTGASVSDMKAEGIPSYNEYVRMRENMTQYTDGKLVVTSWKWNKEEALPGHSAGLCVAQPEPSDAYWSCWEY